MTDMPYIVIECPKCGEQAAAEPEMVGSDAACPACEHVFFVLSPGAAAVAGTADRSQDNGTGIEMESQKPQPASAPIPESAAMRPDLDHVSLLMHALVTGDPTMLGECVDLKGCETWRYAALAELFAHAVVPLRECVTQRTFNVTSTWMFSKAKAVRQVEDSFRIYLAILTHSHAVIADNLPDPPADLEMEFLEEYFHEIRRQIHRVEELHRDIIQLSMPAKQPFTELQELMLDWSAAYLAGLESLISALRRKSKLPPHETLLSTAQTTLASTSMTRFLTLYRQMQEA